MVDAGRKFPPRVVATSISWDWLIVLASFISAWVLAQSSIKLKSEVVKMVYLSTNHSAAETRPAVSNAINSVFSESDDFFHA